MATRVDYVNGINAEDIGTIYLTGAGYVNYPFRGASRESALGWEEPVWGADLNRSIDLVMDNIDDVDYGLVARCEISYKYLNVQDYRVLCKIAKQKVCTANFFNRETGERVTQEMAFTGNEIGKLYKFGTDYLGVLDMSIKLVATNRDRTDIISATHTITYNANGGTGTIESKSVTWANQATISDGTGITRSGKTLLSWNTNADGSGESYLPGQKVTIFKDMDLFAQWDVPYFSGLNFKGLDSNGNITNVESNIVAYSIGDGIENGSGMSSNFKGGHVVIPSTYNGKPVTQISDYAFFAYDIPNDYPDITSVEIPNTITKIGYQAFSAAKIKECIIPDSVTYMPNAFAFCRELESIKLPNANADMSYTFYGCDKIKHVVIPEKIQQLEQTFNWCKSLSSITFEGGSELTLFTLMFENGNDKSALEEIKIPASVNKLSLGNCKKLKRIYLFTTGLTNCAISSADNAKIYIPQEVSDATSAYGQNWNHGLEYFAVL